MTAEELFEKYKVHITDRDEFEWAVLSRIGLKSALTEDRKEIRDKIEDEIAQYKILIDESDIDVDNLAYMQAIVALTEILTFIKEK
jgi:hypothetical protein